MVQPVDQQNLTEPGVSRQFFSIGAVTRMTGLSVHSLRAWEKRFPGFRIARSQSGQRQYSEADVTRLKCIKALLDNGYKISELVNLSVSQLENMLIDCGAINRPPSVGDQKGEKKIILGIWGGTLVAQINKYPAEFVEFQIAINTTSKNRLVEYLAANQVDKLVLEIDTLSKQGIKIIQDIQEHYQNTSIVVVYRYGHRELIDQVKTLNVALLRGPVELSTFAQYLKANGIRQNYQQIASLAEPPAHQFSQKQLAQLAELHTLIDCECPQHLANLIVSLSAFESYSQQCENRNAEDAALHNEMYKTTAQARSLMENILMRVLVFEGIKLT